jgi:hypothetical protein
MIAPKSSQCIPDAAYRFLLLLYPPGFRLRFGPDMLQVFRDTYSDQARCGGFEHRLRFWVSVLVDTACSLPCEWGQTLLKSEEISLTLCCGRGWILACRHHLRLHDGATRILDD